MRKPSLVSLLHAMTMRQFDWAREVAPRIPSLRSMISTDTQARLKREAQEKRERKSRIQVLNALGRDANYYRCAESRIHRFCPGVIE